MGDNKFDPNMDYFIHVDDKYFEIAEDLKLLAEELVRMVRADKEKNKYLCVNRENFFWLDFHCDTMKDRIKKLDEWYKNKLEYLKEHGGKPEKY